MKKKKRLSFIGKIFIFFIISGLIGFVYFSYGEDLLNFNKEVPKIEKKIKKPKEHIYKATVLGTGDALVHQPVYNSALRDGGGVKYDFTYAFSEIKDIVANYDIAYYNQETVFAGASYKYSGYPRFNTPSEVGDYLISTGFNTVSLATNHSMDKNEQGALNSIAYWDNTEVMHNGMAASEEERQNVTIKTVNNISYALLSYTTSTNGLPVPNGKEYLVNTYDEQKVREDVERIRDKVDIIIVAIHWGYEYTHNPSEQQKQIANYLASLNVDIVFGSHPHVIQPIQKINNTIVYYSLGNFISNQHELLKKIGMFATLSITKTVNDQGTTINISDVGAELIYTYYENGYQKHLVVPFSKMEEKYLSNYPAIYEKYKGILLQMDPSFIIKPLNEITQ